MPSNPSPKPQRWRAVSDLSIEKRGEPVRLVKAGDEVTDAPDNWPPKWVIEQGLVVPIEDDQATTKKSTPAAGSDEKGAR